MDIHRSKRENNICIYKIYKLLPFVYYKIVEMFGEEREKESKQLGYIYI